MSNLHAPASPVNPERLPYRPLLAPPQIVHWTDECGALHVLLSGRRESNSYELIPLSTDIGGCAFRWFKKDGECYDVLANGDESSCSCAGWAYTGGCKHIATTFRLLETGVLQVAPDSGATEHDDAA